MKKFLVCLLICVMSFGLITCAYADEGENIGADSSTATDITTLDEAVDQGLLDDSLATPPDLVYQPDETTTEKTETGTTVSDTLDKAVESTTGSDSILGNWDGDSSDLLGIDTDITIEQIGDKLEEKGFSIVRVLQKVGRVICFIIFLICCIMVIISIVGNPKACMQGVVGCVCSGLMYMCITYGPQIVKVIANFFVI